MLKLKRTELKFSTEHITQHLQYIANIGSYGTEVGVSDPDLHEAEIFRN